MPIYHSKLPWCQTTWSYHFNIHSFPYASNFHKVSFSFLNALHSYSVFLLNPSLSFRTECKCYFFLSTVFDPNTRIKFPSIVFSCLYIHLFWDHFMVHIISYGIVSSLKPDIHLHLNLSLTVSTINHCLINILIEKEKRLCSQKHCLSTKTTTQISTDGGKLSVNYSVYIWGSITHSLKCYCEIKYIKMLKNLRDIMATNLITKEGNFIEDLCNNYAKSTYVNRNQKAKWNTLYVTEIWNGWL